jgi:hypothetical protein
MNQTLMPLFRVVTGMDVKWLRQNTQEESVVIKRECRYKHSAPSRQTDNAEKHFLCFVISPIKSAKRDLIKQMFRNCKDLTLK